MRSIAQTGCTDYQATNFDPVAVTNDGSCIYSFTYMPLTLKCNVDSLELHETSGIVHQNNNFWTHVDDANTAIYKIDTLSSTIFQRVTINNAVNNDWEDISGDNNFIYVGDIGNNSGNRTNLCIYKILKTSISPSTVSVSAGKINYSYADQQDFTVNHNHNFYECESFFVLNNSIHLFTKGWVNKWTKHYVMPADTGIQVAQFVDSFNVGGLITSAAIQGDSLVVLLGLNFSGSTDCFVWMLNKFNGTNFFSGNKRRLYIGRPYTIGQTEGICFSDINKGYITNEQIGSIPAQIKEFDLNRYLAPPPPTPFITVSTNSVMQSLKACSDTGQASFTIKNLLTSFSQDLHFTIGGLPSWVTASTTSDSLVPGDSMQITLSFASGTLNGGNYTANIIIQSDDQLHPVQIISCSMHIDFNPCIDFSFTSDTCNGFANFFSSSINIPTNYYWDFGDGDTSSQANPIHGYATNGSYVTTLIACNAAGCDSAIQNVGVTITGPKTTNCYPETQSYCCGVGITQFRLSGPTGDVINNFSSDASVGYEDFSCIDTGNVFTNYPYVLTCTTATSIGEYLKVWLDMNNDGLFDPVFEELFYDIDTILPVHSGILMIPALLDNVYGIPLRMRVASDYQLAPEPCLDPHYGQHEDYSVILNLSTVGVNDVFSETGLSIFPNPFSQSTSIEYKLNRSSNVSFDIYDILGEKVASLFNSQMQSPGRHHFEFNDCKPGIYFVKLSVDDRSFVKRVVKMN